MPSSPMCHANDARARVETGLQVLAIRSRRAATLVTSSTKMHKALRAEMMANKACH